MKSLPFFATFPNPPQGLNNAASSLYWQFDYDLLVAGDMRKALCRCSS